MYANPRFEASILSRSWEWLDALTARLPIEVRLVDLNAALRLPGNVEASTPLTRLIVSGAAELRSLVTSVTTGREPQLTTIGELQIAAYPLADDLGIVGTVLMTSTFPSPRGSADLGSGVLKLVCDGVFHAIQVQARTPQTPAAAPIDDVGWLWHVLDATASYGSDRELVVAFASAVAYSKGIEVYGYVPVSPNAFAIDVRPASMSEAQMPDTIRVGDLPSVTGLTTLSTAQAEALGLERTRNFSVARVSAGGDPWLLVLSGTVPVAEMARLSVYLPSLEQLMRMVTSDAVMKLVTTISAHLLEHGEESEAVPPPLDALRAAIGMSDVSLTVTSRDGTPLIQIVRADVPPTPGDFDNGARFATLRRVAGRYTLRLVLTTTDRRRATPHQRAVAEAVTNVLDAWVRRVLPHLEQRDRRAAARPFDQVLDRFANDALQRGATVAVLVALATDTALPPGMTQRWIGRIRAIMRASDIVGMLGEGEIGLLLHDSTRDQAEAVGYRVAALLEAPDEAHGSSRAAVGIATRRPNGGGSTGIAAEARSDALARAKKSVQEQRRDAPEKPRRREPPPPSDPLQWGSLAMD